MEISDRDLCHNMDWDPNYLKDIFQQDFYEFPELWNMNVNENELVKVAENVEKYSPTVEDISLDDETLTCAVKQIENE